MKKPSEAWKDYLTEVRTENKAASAAYETYVKKYSKTDNVNFPRDEKVSETFFIPGKMYTFLYTTPNKVTKERPVINRRPVILSLGLYENMGKIYEMGIDLILVPPKVRIYVLDQLYKFFNKDINENIANIEDGRIGKKALKLNYEIAKKIFDQLGWQMALCVYSKENIKQSAVYDYEDWVSVIPLYTYAVEGKQPNEIYNLYIKKITKPPEPKLNE